MAIRTPPRPQAPQTDVDGGVIADARRRQRLHRGIVLGTALVGLTLGLVIAATSTSPRRDSPAGSPAPTAIGSCTAGDFSAQVLRVSVGETVDQEAIKLVNEGSGACPLSGVPVLKLANSKDRVIYVPAQVASGNRGAVTLGRNQAASFWVQELAPNGNQVPYAKRAELLVHGIKGPVALKIGTYLTTSQQLIVSEITAGVLRAAPRSTATAPACKAAQLRVTTHFLDAAMSGSNAAEVLTNTGAGPCSLGGRPSGAFLRNRHLAPPDTGSRITLATGASASVLLTSCVGPGAGHPNCTTASTIAAGIYRAGVGFTDIPSQLH